jgi:hypothetical protein
MTKARIDRAFFYLRPSENLSQHDWQNHLAGVICTPPSGNRGLLQLLQWVMLALFPVLL